MQEEKNLSEVRTEGRLKRYRQNHKEITVAIWQKDRRHRDNTKMEQNRGMQNGVR